MSTNREEVRKKILQIYCKNPSCSYNSIAKKLKTTYATVRRTIIRFSEASEVKRKPGSGKSFKTSDKKIETKVLLDLKRNPTLSLRDLAKKNYTNHVKILRIKKKYNFKSYKKFVVPRRDDKQQNTAIRRSRKLYKYLLINKESCIILDDETYCKANFESLPRHQ